MFDPARIQRETFVADVELFESLPSTNDYAAGRAAAGFSGRPLLVVAEQQTAGRGRGANRWWSCSGALTFSLLLDELSNAPVARLSLAAGLAICEALRALDPRLETRLKWPNDVYLDERKVAGILIERIASAPETLILGVGLNVNNRLADAPDEVRSRAMSLADATGAELSPEQVLIAVLQHLEAAYAVLDEHPWPTLDRCRELCLLRGRQVVIDVGEQQHAGRCLGIDDDGALVIETPAGQSRCATGVVTSFDRSASAADRR
ncbi:MAG: biotin--[acetyl-CoA-carboxylase] ligase [Planctomycetota bacterium]|mgnify:CR=1 FL=1|nr:MAG: biotin--[acetyl-CoA-carboxylase] ligase [Planctomycetota bacterium]REJ88962.1 MAG: biotin--[acetyl-CoA-carboxylase] ligase [Planctomycetota bacterium]REK31210.1 MAG: biotin--[acetyl-CoA-carboxylase] ligase [Planctomycetota bacterium]REK43548.1 MAG: biotin--[acetyl-CoA-carboxylase] ligase [Planctomycetota bacterium]